jgi:hypothetical protein
MLECTQYVNCHRLSDKDKIQLWVSRPKEGDVVNGKADREKLVAKPLRCCFRKDVNSALPTI